MVIVIPENILNFFAVRYVYDDPFKGFHFALTVKDALRKLKYPFAFSADGSDLIFVLKGEPLRKYPFPLIREKIALLRSYDIVKGKIPVVDEAFRRISGQLHTAVGDKLHRPVRIIITPVCHSGKMGEEDCLAPFAFRQ